MTNYKIYVLKDPITKEIRYVGYTGQLLEKRLAAHIQDCKKVKDSHRTNWIKQILSTGSKPIIELLKDQLTQKDAIKMEIDCIAQFPNLTNGTRGGDGIPNPSQHIRDKISNTLKAGYKSGRIKPTKTNKVSGVNHPMYGVTGVNNPNYGSKRTEEQIINLSQCKIGSKNPMYGKKGTLCPSFNKPCSEDKKKKISNTLIGKISKKRGTGRTVIKFFDGVAIEEINGYQLDTQRGNIYRCCKGITQTAYGFVWKFKDELL